MDVGIKIANAIQKYVIGGYEIRSKHDLREEDGIENKDIFVLDEENGVYFGAKVTLVDAKAGVDDTNVFELKDKDGKVIKLHIVDITEAKRLYHDVELPVNTYMLDKTESENFDEVVAAKDYVQSTFLSLMTGDRGFAVTNKALLKAEVSSHGEWRTAFAKFIDPMAEIVKPKVIKYTFSESKSSKKLDVVENEVENEVEKELKGELSKSKITGKAVFAAGLFAVAGILLTGLSASGIGLTFLALMPIAIPIFVALLPLGTALLVHLTKGTLEGDTKAIIVYASTAVAFATLLATFCWVVPVLSIALALPLMLIPVVGIALLIVVKIVDTRLESKVKIKNILKVLGLVFTITPLLMGAVSYLITSIVLVRPIVAGLSLLYEQTVNSVYNNERTKPEKIIGGIGHFITAIPLGLLAGICTIFGAKSPLSEVHFDKKQMDDASKFWAIDICHAMALAIANNFWRACLAATVVALMAVAIASTGGFAGIIAVIPFIGNVAAVVSQLPLIGSFASWLFVTGPVTAILSSTAIAGLTISLGSIVSIVLAIPLIKQAFELIKDLLALNVKTGLRVTLLSTALGVTLIIFVGPVIGGALIGSALVYFLITGLYYLYKRNSIAELSDKEKFAIRYLTFGLYDFYQWYKARKVKQGSSVEEIKQDQSLLEKTYELKKVVSSDISISESEGTVKPKKSISDILGNIFLAIGAIITVVGIIWLIYLLNKERRAITKLSEVSSIEAYIKPNVNNRSQMKTFFSFFGAFCTGVGIIWIIYVLYQKQKAKKVEEQKEELLTEKSDSHDVADLANSSKEVADDEFNSNDPNGAEDGAKKSKNNYDKNIEIINSQIYKWNSQLDQMKKIKELDQPL